MDAALPVGPNGGSRDQSKPPRAARRHPGPPKGAFGTKTGPLGCPRSAVEVSVGPANGSLAQIRPPGAARGPPGPQKGLFGPKRALLGAPAVLLRSLKGPKHMVWMRPTQLDQPVAVGPKSGPPGLPTDLRGLQKGLFGPKRALLGTQKCC